MAWTLNGTRIFVQKFSGSGKQIKPRLQPLSGGTVVQTFGYETEIINCVALIVGDTNLNRIKDYYIEDTTCELVSPEGSKGNFKVVTVSYDRVSCICQSFDLTQLKDAPVYNIELELYPV
jgi:hypothetical protein